MPAPSPHPPPPPRTVAFRGRARLAGVARPRRAARAAAATPASPPPEAQEERGTAGLPERVGSAVGTAKAAMAKVAAPVTRRLDGNARLIERHRRTVELINALEDEFAALTPEALRAKTAEFRQRLASGADTLDSLLPEAFAALRESARRVLGLRLYDVQLIGAMVLNDGAVAEMGTGEGKTLVAQLAAYLNSLARQGVHVVTVNDYLARRDADLARRVMAPLGVSVGCIVSSLEPYSKERGVAYGSDITYAANTELGFDTLRDNLARAAQDVMIRRPFAFAIVDEVDSVLVDEGRNPLLLSNESGANVYRFPIADAVARRLVRDVHFRSDRKRRSVELTDEGMDEAGLLLSASGHGTDDVWDGVNPWAPYIICALNAQNNYERDAEYILRNGEVQIVDDFTGRVMPGRRWQDGLHQAVEAKEGVEVQNESTTIASTTYQMLFASYPKLSGMTGTATTEKTELWATYGLEVVKIPPNRPSQRVDFDLQLYVRSDTKFEAVVREITYWHVYHGRPVLVGTTTVENSERISNMLRQSQIPHSLLNARPQFAAQEAAVVAQAGRLGAVTISTNMAGRGTDIVLGGNAAALAKESLLRFMLPAICGDNPPADDEEDQIYDYTQLAMSASLTEAEVEDASPKVLGQLQLAGLGARTECADKSVPRSAARRLISALMDVVQDGFPAEGVTRDAYREAAEAVGLSETFGQPKLEAAAAALYDVARGICSREQQQVIATGGLHIIGTDLHESRRIDNQLRGRAGRQGDPGSTVFLISFEDAIMMHSPPGALSSFVSAIGQGDEDTPLVGGAFTNYAVTVQKAAENFYAYMRRMTLETDEVMELHRSRCNRLRSRLLMGSPRLRRQALLLYLRRLGRDLTLTYADAATPPNRWELGTLLDTLQNQTGGGAVPVLAGVSEAQLSAALGEASDSAAAEALGVAWWRDGRTGGQLPEDVAANAPNARPRRAVACRPGDGPIRRYATAAAMHAHVSTAARRASRGSPAPNQAAQAVGGVSVGLAPLTVSGANHRDALARWLDMDGDGVWVRVDGRWSREFERLASIVGDALCHAYLERIGTLATEAAVDGVPLRVAWEEVEVRERLMLLATLDENWQAHLRSETQLRSASYLQSVGQRDPQEVYRTECHRLFERTLDEARKGAATEALRFAATQAL